jgi:prophage endopeptidase
MSIFNPWVILGFIFAIGASATGGYHKGVHSEQNKQKLIIAKLNEEARVKEQALANAVNTTATQLVKVNNEAKVQIAKRDAAITAGTLKLRIPTKTVCPVPTPDNPAPSGGNSVQTGAELDPTTARSLVAITDQGDSNTRQLNACIDAYNAAYQTLKGQK